MNGFYIKNWSAWSPGLESKEDWKNWSEGLEKPEMDSRAPALKHLPPISRRRLSQLTKMVLHVGHDLNDGDGQYCTIFCSQFGEITQQNKISRGLIDTGEVRPSVFSLSVFNTPVSLLSIHEKNLEPATVQLSGEAGLMSGILSLIAELNTNQHKDVLILFADEMLPEDYKLLYGKDLFPYAFGLLCSTVDSGSDLFLNLERSYENYDSRDSLSPVYFLKWLLNKETALDLYDCGVLLKITKKREICN